MYTLYIYIHRKYYIYILIYIYIYVPDRGPSVRTDQNRNILYRHINISRYTCFSKWIHRNRLQNGAALAASCCLPLVKLKWISAISETAGSTFVATRRHGCTQGSNGQTPEIGIGRTCKPTNPTRRGVMGVPQDTFHKRTPPPFQRDSNEEPWDVPPHTHSPK